MIPVVWVRVPDFPVTVRVLVVKLAPPFAVKVIVLAVFVGFGENAAVTPFGSPDAERLTLLLNPPVGLIEIVLETLAPCFTETLAGDAVMEKPSAFTMSETEALALL